MPQRGGFYQRLIYGKDSYLKNEAFMNKIHDLKMLLFYDFNISIHITPRMYKALVKFWFDFDLI